MREVLAGMVEWRRNGHRFAVATVIETWGSSPRPVGSMMGVRDDGLVCGSVSGGCIEASVIEEARSTLLD